MSYQLFHSKYFGLLVLGLIIGISFLLMFIASSGESVTLDEVAHIPAGYSYVKYFDYRLNHEHPPLVKVLSALPLLFQKINFPLENQFWQEGLSNQWSFGGIFFHESDNDAQKIVEWARLAPMILTILLVIVIYIWSKELIGRWWLYCRLFSWLFRLIFLLTAIMSQPMLGQASVFSSPFIFSLSFLLVNQINI